MPRTITDFFGGSKRPNATPEAEPAKPKKPKVDLTTSPKKATKQPSVPKTPKTPSKSVQKSPAKDTKALKRAHDEVVDLDFDDDSDLEMLDFDEIEELSPPPRGAKPKSEGSASKSASKSPAKARSARQEPQTSEKSKSAEEVLQGIPDAEFPEADPAKKFNFYAAKAKAEAVESAAAGATLPEARENCFAGMTFVFTGIMPTVSRDQAEAFIKTHGGKVTSAPSGKTTVVVLGEDAGPKKIEKIRALKIKTIDENGLLQLIREMPADGGSGEEAKKALERKKDADAKVEESARQLAEQFRAQEKKSKSDTREAATSNRTGGGGQPQPLSTSQMWTQKYAPRQLGDLVGNNAAINRLGNWLRNWRENSKRGFKPGNGEGSEFRAVLIHGPPGIGKTSAAHLVAKLQGFDVIENNASDTRSKGLLQSQVSKTLTNTSLGGFFSPSGATADSLKPLCVIMDEVDGMSAGDRGGVGAMAALARTTKVPLILIANDKSLPKMRPFDRVTFDMPFRRPDAATISKRLTAIAINEGLKLDGPALEQLVQATRNDIRQILTLLSTYATTNKVMSYKDGAEMGKRWEKEVSLKPFDITSRYISGSLWHSNNKETLNDKIELYFNDYDLAPLMMQENYLNTLPRDASSTKGGALALAADAAASISDGDLVDRMIHGSQQQWSLMPLHAIMSCVLPSYYVAGQGKGRLNFPSWLGNNSKGGKYRRLLAELQAHMRLKLWAASNEVRLEYQPEFARLLLAPLLKQGSEGIDEVIKLMDAYYLTRDDFDVIMELGVGPQNSEEQAKKIPTAVKSSFTRTYNGMAHPLPFMKHIDTKTVNRKPAEVPDLDDVVIDDMEPEPEAPEEESMETQITNDKYIKRAKPKAKPAAKSKAKPKAKPKAKK